ncbi:MAG: hypothetical protein M3083_09770 [Actinomycetota bacterium]|nr:hypothetical protein [Actinomycetota bacterium]
MVHATGWADVEFVVGVDGDFVVGDVAVVDIKDTVVDAIVVDGAVVVPRLLAGVLLPEQAATRARPRG